MENMSSLFSSIHDFLMISLPRERKSSEKTIRSYKKSLELFWGFVKAKTGKPFAELSFENINRNILSDFLEHLETERNCSVSTRNQRLHCICSFYRYAAGEDISIVCHLNEIVKVRKAKQEKPLVEHMSETAVQTILAQPDTTPNTNLQSNQDNMQERAVIL